MLDGVTELGAFLRARRAARSPAAAGLPGGGRRRAPGLRREELAALAGVSVDYLVRLERGVQRDPSPEVLGALAAALGLDGDARRHLFELAGRTEPRAVDPAVRTVPAPLRRLLASARPAPAWVLNRRCDLVARNDPADALFGELPADANHVALALARRDLWGDPALVVQDAVAHLRAATVDARDHPAVVALVRELSGDPEFARLWAAREVRAACSPLRRVRHPQAGDLEFDVQLLDAGDLQLVVLEPRDVARWVAHLDGPGRRRLRLA